MTAAAMDDYRRAQDGFDAVVAAVAADQWDAPSACREWTVRDVVGHVVWGQEQMRHWAIGQDYGAAGGPGTPHSGALASHDPLATWPAARAASLETLTAEALPREVAITGLGLVPLSAMVTVLVTDTLAHTWDIAHALGIDEALDQGLIPGSFAWARANVVRMPGFFGPDLTPPADADEQTRWLAFLGRAAWKPVREEIRA